MTKEVWYAAYGSNLHVDRLAYYLLGGRPPDAGRDYPGSREPRMPGPPVPLELPGALYFATESPVWTGGRAFYDPDAPGRVLSRAYRLTAVQFSDLAAQEMYRAPGGDLDLGPVLRDGRAACGAGRYETLVSPGALDGLPLLTFTAPWRMDEVEHTVPAAGYLRHLAAGLLAAGVWDRETVTGYLAARPGAAGHWTAPDIAALLE
ncbi:histone deacetylase [Streptomyces sp. ODS05-4]|uniref:histone deacetylase n=1 Tax=Streptomyces sp. ODS05-4 TaxID=2944939 RepID=UPI00210B77DD|nr:histone deacetylase [Streptomyces sp. ODS05-4]